VEHHLSNFLVPVSFPQTRTVIGPIQIITATDGLFNHVDDELPMWSGDGDRSVVVDIMFNTLFKASPVITIGLIGMDCDNSQNFRFWLKATNVKSTGFTIEFTTWGTTHIARAGVSWQAIGEIVSDPAKPKDRAIRTKNQKS